MAFDLRIVVTGLCTLTQDPDTRDLVVLFVNATQANEEQSRLGMHVHIPFLGVKVGEWVEHHSHWHPSSMAPTLTGGALGVFELANEELRIETSTPLQLDRTKPQDRSPKTPSEESNLSWIPELPRVDESCGRLDPSCLGDFDGRVIARLRVTGGRVSCSKVARSGANPLLWDFKTSPGRESLHTQSIGDRIAIDMTVPSPDENDGYSHIVSSRNGRSLLLAEPEPRQRIDIVLGNLPLSEHQHGEPAEIGHYRWLYELSRNPPRLDERPVPFLSEQSGRFTASGIRPCAMGADWGGIA